MMVTRKGCFLKRTRPRLSKTTRAMTLTQQREIQMVSLMEQLQRRAKDVEDGDTAKNDTKRCGQAKNTCNTPN